MIERPGMVSIDRIKEGLEARAYELCTQLLPNGRRERGEFMVGGVSGEPGSSMMVNLGSRAGVWADFATGESGDAIDLIAAVLFAGNKGEAIRWARSWLGLDGLDPHRLKVTRQAVVTKARQDETALTDDERRDRAARMFRGAKCHGLLGTPADDYLHGRGISLRQLGRLPGALAYGPNIWNPEKRANLPAMLACVQRRGVQVGVHRTFLAIDGPGRARKAALLNPKLSLGPLRGGVIPLWRGDSRLGWQNLWDAELALDWPECEADRAVTLTEGIEDALSIAVAEPKRRVAACVSLANMGSAELPPCLKEVTIAADNDPPHSKAATDGLPRVVRELTAQGRKVRVARPPLPYKDFNAWLQVLQAPSASGAAA